METKNGREEREKIKKEWRMAVGRRGRDAENIMEGTRKEGVKTSKQNGVGERKRKEKKNKK